MMLDYATPINWANCPQKLIQRWKLLPGMFGSGKFYGLNRNLDTPGIANGVSQSSWRTETGHGGFGANYYNGSSTYWDIGTNTAFDVQTITAGAWINPTSVATSFQLAFTKDNGSGAWYLGLKAANTYCVTFPGGSAKEAIGSTTLVANTWYYLMFVADGVNLTSYLNGVQDATLSAAAPALKPSDKIMIGRRQQAASPLWFTGMIDDCVFFNAAFSATQAMDWYQSLRHPDQKTLNWIDIQAAVAAASHRNRIIMVA